MPRLSLAASPALTYATAFTILAAAIVVPRAQAQPSGRVAYLIDFASRTLDLVDLENGTVMLGVEPVGDVPNQIEVRGTTAYVVNSSPEGLQIIDLAGPTTAGTVAFAAGTNPWAVALAGDRAYVSLWGSDQVAVVDLGASTIIDLIDVGVSPEGMCLAGNKLYVANSGFVEFGTYDPGTVSVIDTGTNDVVHTIPVGLNPQWCAVDGEGEVHVVCSDLFGANNGRVFVLDPQAPVPADSLWVGGFPGPIAISAGAVGWMVEYEAGLLAIDTATHTVLHDINDPVSAGGLGALGLDLDLVDRVHVALSADGLLTVVTPEGKLAGSYAVGPGPQDVALYESGAVAVQEPPDELSGAGEPSAPAGSGPAGFGIAARPNPARPAPASQIAIEIASEAGAEAAEVVAFDAAGRAIALLHRGPLAAGTTRLTWDGRDAGGHRAPPGAYFIRVIGKRVIGKRGTTAAKIVLLP